jgi:hypothetical protein
MRASLSQVDRLAEALANGAPSVAAAGRIIGVTPGRARALFARIKADLGRQAA